MGRLWRYGVLVFGFFHFGLRTLPSHTANESQNTLPIFKGLKLYDSDNSAYITLHNIMGYLTMSCTTAATYFLTK